MHEDPPDLSDAVAGLPNALGACDVLSFPKSVNARPAPARSLTG